ncbi:hypothetical protein L596_027109 [Steinernema carpocapsae]|uniref:Uncharacterized protein n=1 Tax=Steinernema carpocapsae TaxID=34508 RepID=A0A4U5M3E0_STECR|nr:hypothetical protein L596_027109 [Steinernema carpocapsae]
MGIKGLRRGSELQSPAPAMDLQASVGSSLVAIAPRCRACDLVVCSCFNTTLRDWSLSDQGIQAGIAQVGVSGHNWLETLHFFGNIHQEGRIQVSVIAYSTSEIAIHQLTLWHSDTGTKNATVGSKFIEIRVPKLGNFHAFFSLNKRRRTCTWPPNEKRRRVASKIAWIARAVCVLYNSAMKPETSTGGVPILRNEAPSTHKIPVNLDPFYLADESDESDESDEGGEGGEGGEGPCDCASRYNLTIGQEDCNTITLLSQIEDHRPVQCPCTESSMGSCVAECDCLCEDRTEGAPRDPENNDEREEEGANEEPSANVLSSEAAPAEGSPFDAGIRRLVLPEQTSAALRSEGQIPGEREARGGRTRGQILLVVIDFEYICEDEVVDLWCVSSYLSRQESPPFPPSSTRLVCLDTHSSIPRRCSTSPPTLLAFTLKGRKPENELRSGRTRGRLLRARGRRRECRRGTRRRCLRLPPGLRRRNDEPRGTLSADLRSLETEAEEGEKRRGGGPKWPLRGPERVPGRARRHSSEENCVPIPHLRASQGESGAQRILRRTHGRHASGRGQGAALL